MSNYIPWIHVDADTYLFSDSGLDYPNAITKRPWGAVQ